MAGELLRFVKINNAVVHIDPSAVLKVEETVAGDKKLLMVTTDDGDRFTVFDNDRDGVKRFNEARAALFAGSEVSDGVRDHGETGGAGPAPEATAPAQAGGA